MTTPGAGAAASLFVRVLLWVAAARFGVALVAGALSMGGPAFAPRLLHSGDVLTTFGSASQALGVPLLLVAVVVLWWQGGTGIEGERALRRWRGECIAAGWLLALTAVSAALEIVGVSLQASAMSLDRASRVTQVAGFSAADLVVCVGALGFVRVLVLHRAATSRSAATAAGVGAVFAVDRRSGDVLAWPSFHQALAEAPVFGIEDEDYDFYRDDGTVLAAAIVDDRVTLTPADSDGYDELLVAVQAFAAARDLTIDPHDVDEPLAYVDPINRWHYLQLWPGWLRWVAHLARPPR